MRSRQALTVIAGCLLSGNGLCNECVRKKNQLPTHCTDTDLEVLQLRQEGVSVVGEGQGVDPSIVLGRVAHARTHTSNSGPARRQASLSRPPPPMERFGARSHGGQNA